MNTETARPPILIVEDSEADFVAIRRALLRTGLQNPLCRFDNGADALAYLFREGIHADPDDSPRPGAVLLDLELPGLNGREVLARIKGHSELRCIPVIVLTGNEGRQDVERCYELGANSFIRKPSDPETLYAAFQSFADFWFGIASLPRSEDAGGMPAAPESEG